MVLRLLTTGAFLIGVEDMAGVVLPLKRPSIFTLALSKWKHNNRQWFLAQHCSPRIDI
jgi:hypothetical protein